MNSGGIRGSFEIGNISMADLLTVMPFGNTIDLITIKGRYIKETFEKAAARMKPDGETSSGGFLQVSGANSSFLKRDMIVVKPSISSSKDSS